MITISLCMIVRNEEEVLARCLESVKDAVDEIIIMDTGSTDETKAIALRYTDKVFDFEWIDDFSAARNAAYDRATMDYQMWLDADDVLPPEEAEKLLRLKETLDPNIDMVAMKYITHFDENGVPVHISTRERMMKRERGFRFTDPIHEFIALTPNTLYSDIVIHHKQLPKEGRSDRNLRVYEALEAKGAEFSPRQVYYFARELKDHGHWAKSTYYFERFLDSEKGWSEDNIAACHALSICYNALGDRHKIRPILTKSFIYDAPRAEICSEIGYYYKKEQDYKTALKWFNLAAGLDETDSRGFILKDYWGYIPNIEACVCAFELGDFDAAYRYNERAAEFKPNAAAIAINRKVLEGRINDQVHVD